MIEASETLVFGGPERRRMENFEMWCYKMLLKGKWTNKTINQKVLEYIDRAKNEPWSTLERLRAKFVWPILRHQSLVNFVVGGTDEDQIIYIV